MRVTGARWCARLIRVVWLVAVTTFLSAPALAGDTGSGKRSSGIRESAAQFVARAVSTEPPPGRVRHSQASASTGSTSFFKSRPGMIVLAAVAAGTGYAIYSTQHDRIHSPGKK